MDHRKSGAPNRRVFKIDVSDLTPSEVYTFMKLASRMQEISSYTDPQATGEEFVLFNINALHKA